jgi:hypothetical protein
MMMMIIINLLNLNYAFIDDVHEMNAYMADHVCLSSCPHDMTTAPVDRL